MGEKAMAGFILSSISAILVISEAVMLLVFATWAEGFMYMMGMHEIRRQIFGEVFTTVGIIDLLFGIAILIGAYLIYTGNEAIGGILVIAFSIMAMFLAGGGFWLGAVLGIIGGILGLLKE